MSKRFGSVVALAELSLDVAEGELVTVLGPSGSGKSTLLRLVAGLERPDAGRVSIDGRDVTAAPASSRGVAMVFQSFALFPHMTVAENMAFGLRARGGNREEAERRVRETALALGLEEVLGRRPAQLSGGERQRVALARSLVGRPRVLLMDEPLSNLDARLRGQARAEIRRLHAGTGVTALYVTHDQHEALTLGARVAVLDDGEVQQYGRADEVYEHPANLTVARFLGTPPMNLLPARVVAGALVACDGAARLPLPRGNRARPGDQVVAGFRPEHAICPAPEGAGSLRAVLEVAEQAGHDRVWHLRAGDESIAVRPLPGAVAVEGSNVEVEVEAEHVRLFAADTGAALA